jgi:hypothetical protein
MSEKKREAIIGRELLNQPIAITARNPAGQKGTRVLTFWDTVYMMARAFTRDVWLHWQGRPASRERIVEIISTGVTMIMPASPAIALEAAEYIVRIVESARQGDELPDVEELRNDFDLQEELAMELECAGAAAFAETNFPADQAYQRADFRVGA